MNPRLPFVLMLVSAPLALGQSQPPAATPPEEPEEVITLPQFTVASPKGYLVEDSGTGARIAVKLNEHPFTVNVVTSDFIRDFAGLELREWFSYTPAFAVQEGEGNYIVRGQKATGALRNGFLRSGMVDSVNIERAEVIKGPAAAIYGRTAPGGIVNLITKKAPAVPIANVSYQIGGYGLQRGQVSVGGPVVPGKVFCRFDGSVQTQNETVGFYAIKNRALSFATLWKLDKDTSLTVELEYVGRTDTTDSELRVPFIFAPNANRTGAGPQTPTPDKSLKFFNYESGAKDVTGLTRKSWTTNVNFERRLSEVFSFRFGGFIASRPATRRAYDGERWVPELGTFYNRQPLFRFFNERADGMQADLTAEFSTGAVKHKVLLTGDYLFTKNSDQIYRLPANLLSNLAYNRPTLLLSAPDFWFPTLDLSVYKTTGRDQGSNVKYSGGFLSDRITLLGDRLNLMAGLRYTSLHTKLYNNNATNTAANPYLRRSKVSVSAQDPQLGATFRIAKPLTVFASYATSTREQTAVATDNTGNLLTDPEKGRGLEYGIKAETPDGRFQLTASYFDQDRENVVRVDPETQQNVLTGMENSHGVEISGAWSVTENWQVLVSGTQMKARIVKPSRALLVVLDQARALGLSDVDRITQAPEQQYAIATRYNFTRGALKGLTLNAGYKFYGNQLTSNSNITAIQYRQPAYRLVDLGVSYGFKWNEGDRLRHNLRLNIKNALDKTWYFGDRKPGRGQQYIVSYGLAFK